jgi:hypothetical protein
VREHLQKKLNFSHNKRNEKPRACFSPLRFAKVGKYGKQEFCAFLLEI